MGVSLLITPLGDKQMTKKTGYTMKMLCPVKTRDQNTGL